jgi:thiopurine S-methyltransferase
MERSFWQSRWEANQIGFHQAKFTPALEQFHDRMALGQPRRVLVPLCGKSLDMVYLAERGHQVVGVEFVPMAAEAFFEERGLVPQRESLGAVERLWAGPYELLVGDFFHVTPAMVGPVDGAYDRAALIALPPETRQAYGPHLVSLLAPGARLLVVTIDYDGTKMSGPPFCIPKDEPPRIFAKAGEGELLSELDILNRFEESRWRERGMDWVMERVWLFSKGKG